MHKIDVIIPVIRPHRLKNCVNAIVTNAGIPRKDYRIYTMLDRNRIGCPKMVKKLTDATWADFVCFLGDDTRICQDCFRIALDAMYALPDGYGMVGLNDQYHHGGLGFATHWLIARRMLPLLGGEFFHTGYYHGQSDVELTARCKEMDRYVWAEKAKLIHDHPLIDKSIDIDEHYKHAYRMEAYMHDLTLRKKRQKAGWPVTKEMTA